MHFLVDMPNFSVSYRSFQLYMQFDLDSIQLGLSLSCSVEYNASYAYHSLFAYFDRDNVALKGFAK